MEKKKMAVTEAQKRAYTKYDKANTKMFGIKLNKNTDADLIAFLEGGNVQTKIKLALREYLKNTDTKKEQA